MKVKKVQKKKYKEKKSSLVKYNHEIVGILLLALGVLILLSFYFENLVGKFGNIVREVLLGAVGMPAFLLPPVILVYSFVMIFKKDDLGFRLRIMYSLILIFLLSAFIHTGSYNNLKYENTEVMQSMMKFYNEGKLLIGGGIIGGLASLPFLNMFGVVGTLVILTTLSIIDILLLTNISIANISGSMGSSIRNSIENRRTARLMQEKNTKNEDFEMGPEVVGDEENLSLEFKPKPKIIDFKIEKASRELKENTNTRGSKKSVIEPADVEYENFGLVIGDIKNNVELDDSFEEINPLEKKKQKKPQEAIKAKLKAENINEELILAARTGDTQYRYPSSELLAENKNEGQNYKNLRNLAIEGAKKLEDTLKSFGVEARVINVSRGPAVTRYELQPSPGVKVSKIVNLSDDISLNLAAAGVRIEAPIPGKAAIGIEVPNKEMETVYLRDVIEAKDFAGHQSKLAFALGKDISGENVVADIAKMPHLLIAGATGSGKSVCINSLIISLLYKASPDEVKLLMVDPKVVELGIYNGIPHLLIPVVTDPRKAAGALNWAVQEMVNRYKLFAEKGVRDLKGYNAVLKETGEIGLLPQVVIIIDELADLMMVAPNDVEDAICRLAQMARAAGMHLVIATQRPSVDVITGVIKANIPSRIAFSVSSQVDSRTIIDMAGAEKLLGKGDMLFYPVGEPKPIRLKCAFVSDKEVERVVEHIKSHGDAEYNSDIIEEINSESQPSENNSGDNDELLPQAIELVVDAGQASVSLIQRKFKVGYARAARIVDQMEARGVVGGYEGSKPRQVLISKQQWHEMQMKDA